MPVSALRKWVNQLKIKWKILTRKEEILCLYLSRSQLVQDALFIKLGELIRLELQRTQDSWEFLVGCVARFSCKILFQTWHLSKYVIITQIRTATKTIPQIPFRIRIFLFFSYSFGIKTINTFIHYRNSLENHTRFQTKMGKVYTRFQTKTAQTPYPLALVGGTYSYALYKRVPPMGLSSDRYRKMYRFVVHVLRENLKFGHFTSRLQGRQGEYISQN